jgi:hypothetical protein
VAVAELITAVVGSRLLAGSDWQLVVERPIERAERLSPSHPDDGWSAVLGIRRGLKLLVTGNGWMPDRLWLRPGLDSRASPAMASLSSTWLPTGWLSPGCRCAAAGTEDAAMPGFS